MEKKDGLKPALRTGKLKLNHGRGSEGILFFPRNGLEKIASRIMADPEIAEIAIENELVFLEEPKDAV